MLSARVGGSQCLLVIRWQTSCRYLFVLNFRSLRVGLLSISFLIVVCFGD